VLANVRYWKTVAPVVRAQLRRWERRAEAIEDPEMRALALSKLRTERFNAEAGAMLATRAPRSLRADVVHAIVALELLFDLLDGLTERPLADPLHDGELLFGAFTNALAADPDREPLISLADGGYMRELSSAVSEAFARLPAAAVVLPLARASAARAAQAQIRMHAVPRLGPVQLQRWAEAQAQGTGLPWRALLAGAASSVLVLHALIAAAADADTTSAQASQLEGAYLSFCVLLTLLDGLVDEAQDSTSGEPSFIGLWEDRDILRQTLTDVARRAAAQARELSHGAHHLMILTGVVAYYASAPGAGGRLARPLVLELRRTLRPLIHPTLMVMRTWRLARRLLRRSP